MGKGRSPCCDKNQVKRGPWSPAEDLKLTAFIQKHGHDNWRALPRQAGLLRCGKSCRLRWINYLRPDLKRGNFTEEEVETIMRLHEALGNKWSKIASHLPGRTDNEIKNVWNTHLKKRLANKKNSGSGSDESKLESSITSSSSSPSSSSSSSESIFSNKAPNSVSTTAVGEFDTQASQVTMIQKDEQDSVKQVSYELVGITENPNESSTPLSSIESNTSNSSQIVAYKPEKQMGSPFKYLGPYDVNNALQEVDKPNPLPELPLESDYDFWKMLDNIGPIQSNPVQLGQVDASQTPNFGQESVQGSETKKYFQDFENEFGLGATKEANKDQFLQKNNATEAGMDPHSFDFDAMTRPESDSDLDLGYVQWWSSWPQNPGL